MAIFATNERVTFNDIQRVHGPIIRLVDVAEKYILNNIHWRVEFDGSIQRKEIPEIPADAVREALLNSFCHKDHGSGQSNEVAIFKDRIEIYNPGQFPKGYTPEDFIEHPERPIRRNPVIARTLYYSKDVESFGSGLKRIHDACTAAGVKYSFNQLKSGFVVVFYRGAGKGSADIGADKTPISADIIGIIMDFIAQNGSITNVQAQKILGLKETRTKEILRALVKNKVLNKLGQYKGTKYTRHTDDNNE